MKKREQACVATVTVLCTALAAHAHGSRPGHIDEGPGPGTAITIAMVVAWIVIALGMVLLVRRLIRRDKPEDRKKEKQ